jgi:dTDP-4-amino-4,6-dideoxygalactose transaminase
MLANRAKQLRTYGWGAKYAIEIAKGQNSRLDELQASFLRIFLPKLDKDNIKRNEISDFYRESIKNPCVSMVEKSNFFSAEHLFPVKTFQRSNLMLHLKKLKISTAIHYPIPDFKQQGAVNSNLHLPNTEKLSEQLLSLPLFPEMTTEEAKQVVTGVNSFECNCGNANI